jgi:hypothetical protein
MVASALVDLEAGLTLVETLDVNSMPPAAAFWRYLPESTSWRMILAFDSVETEGKRATYEKLQSAIEGFQAIRLKDITVVSPRDKLIVGLRRVLRVRRHLQTPVRLTSTVVNGSYIDDLYIYRL